MARQIRSLFLAGFAFSMVAMSLVTTATFDSGSDTEQLAARYHLRKRTSNFYDRSKISNVRTGSTSGVLFPKG